MEVAGFAFGAVALVPMIYQSFDRALELIADFRSFPVDVQRVNRLLSVQHMLFQRECRLLLELAVGPAPAAEMMETRAHPNWASKSFRDSWANTLGNTFDMPITIVRDSLTEINKLITELRRPNETLEQNSKSKRWQAPIIRQFKKFDWAVVGNAKIKAAIDEVRNQIHDIERLRNQIPGRSKDRGTNKVPVKLRQPTKPCSLPEKIVQAQKGGKSLYHGLCVSASVAPYSLDFQLDKPFNSQSNAPCKSNLRESSSINASDSNNFHVVASVGPGEKGQHRFTVLTIEEMVTAPSHNNIRKRLRQQDEDLEADVINNIVAALCTAPTNLIRPPYFFGYIKSATAASPSSIISRHAVYIDSHDEFSIRFSLEDLVRSSNNHNLLLREDRLRLALSLSLSILKFGYDQTNSWFQEQWRTRNIWFFGDSSPNAMLPEDTNALVPHIETHLTWSADKSQSNPPSVGIAPNSRLFSLGVVLFEIGLGKRLPQLESLDEIQEIVSLNKLLQSDILRREMGGVYSGIVRRCLRCDFNVGHDDFGKQDLQEAFYGMVVCELERLFVTFELQ
ncbi:hypothetical protein EDC01DRAFT_727245 [Geopyxis carbonaria]|nr:hypothetical protein EDC01DRAFT_727245 [Geopyxis carbonaria]